MSENVELDECRLHLAYGDSLGYWVRSGRESKGWSQRKMAKECGLSIVQISKLENGHASTTLETLQRLANAFGKPFVIADQRTPRARARGSQSAGEASTFTEHVQRQHGIVRR